MLLLDWFVVCFMCKNKGICEVEMCLGVMFFVMFLVFVGFIVFGFVVERDFYWVVYFVGVVMCNFCSYFYFIFMLVYVIDSYMSNISEMFIVMNLGK